MRHIDLFSGIGGFSLAGRWAWGNSHALLSFCERDEYCQQVLRKHWPEVPIHDDITTFDAARFKGRADVITAGFPCQPFSSAGQRRGSDDDRYLWPHLLRVVHEVRPRWFVGENVAGLVSMALDQVLSDLETDGYSTEAVIVPACAVGAPHQRDRVFIVAHSGSIVRLSSPVVESVMWSFDRRIATSFVEMMMGYPPNWTNPE